MKKIVFCFDLDNVICKTKSDYCSSKPKINVIKKINKLKDQGHIIKIFTARYMGRNNGKISIAKKQGYKFTKKQLSEWGLNYDELIFGKPVYDVYIDDKNFEFNKNWLKNFSKKY